MMLRKLRIAMLCTFVAVVSLVGLAFPTFAAPILYSIDVETDELVTIDVATGQVDVVGSLGQDVVGGELTTMGNQLFNLDVSRALGIFNLQEINPFTGAVISTTPLNNLGSTLGNAEGLAHVGNQLKIAFSVGDDTTSESLGDLALNGTISNTVAFGATPEGSQTDFDSLGVGQGGRLFFNDSFGEFGDSADDVIYFSLDVTTNALTEISQFPDSGVGALGNDVVSVGTSLYSVTAFDDLVREIDINTGNLIADIPLNRAGNYLGLSRVLVVSAAVPEPATLALMGLGVAGLSFTRRRQREPGVKRRIDRETPSRRRRYSTG